MAERQVKANCYDCKYRGTIPGDAHSKCRHPLVQTDDNEFGALMDMISGKTVLAARKLNIKGNAHGMRRGWFMWPANFDPVWLENCDGFEPKEVI
jgi:hypothetical protein